MAKTRNAMASVAALHQGTPGQMTWLEDPPPWPKPWLRPAQPCVLLCCGNRVNRKLKTLPYLTALFVLFWRWNGVDGVCSEGDKTIKKGRQLFLRKKVHLGYLAKGYSDLKMTWLLYCAGAATAWHFCKLKATVDFSWDTTTGWVFILVLQTCKSEG